MHACRLGASVAVLFVAEPVKGFEVGVATSATNEMLDAFRYNRFAEVAFAEKCRYFSNFFSGGMEDSTVANSMRFFNPMGVFHPGIHLFRH